MPCTAEAFWSDWVKLALGVIISVSDRDFDSRVQLLDGHSRNWIEHVRDDFQRWIKDKGPHAHSWVRYFEMWGPDPKVVVQKNIDIDSARFPSLLTFCRPSSLSIDLTISQTCQTENGCSIHTTAFRKSDCPDGPPTGGVRIDG